MSLPITAVGPLNVETKPILTLFCCAGAGIAASTDRTAAPPTTVLNNITPSQITDVYGY
jgi:hypothetical protein